MKKLLVGLMMTLMISVSQPSVVLAYNFGDYRSETLTGKAWEALNKGDTEAVLAYTNKCIELYAEQAKKMQDSLKEYPAGSNEQIFAYWALNDVSTSLYIQGEAYRKSNMKDEAKEVYNKLIKDFSFGQSFDAKGFFWKPAESAREKLAISESATSLDFGDYTSTYLVAQAWKAMEANKADDVVAYTNKLLELYEKDARSMQSSLTEYPWESKEKIGSYWALNDVGTALYIEGEALKKTGKNSEAKKAYKKLVDEFFYAQCWDPKGWFWKPAEAAQQALDEIGDSQS